MYRYLNMHPKELTVDDCVKRAIALATSMDYYAVQTELNRHKRMIGAKSFNTNHNPHLYVENVLHGEKLSFFAGDAKKRITGAEFCKAHPKGRYILDMPEHWTVCIDGMIYDTWDPSANIVYNAYKITPPVRKRLSLPKTYYVTHELRNTAYRYYSKYIVSLCDEHGKESSKEITGDALLGYKQCLKSFGYEEIKLLGGKI